MLRAIRIEYKNRLLEYIHSDMYLEGVVVYAIDDKKNKIVITGRIF